MQSIQIAESWKPQRQQSPDDMLALVKMMNTAMGGIVVKVDKIPLH